jgi:hypothetical protein
MTNLPQAISCYILLATYNYIKKTQILHTNQLISLLQCSLPLEPLPLALYSPSYAHYNIFSTFFLILHVPMP